MDADPFILKLKQFIETVQLITHSESCVKKFFAIKKKNGGEEGILLGCFFVSCISLIWSALQDSLHLGRLRGVAEVQLLLVRIFSSHEPEKAKLNPTNSHGVVITRRAPAKELPHPVFEAETRPQNHVKFSHYFFFGLRFFHRTSAS